MIKNNELEILMDEKYNLIGKSPNYINKFRFYCTKCNMIFDRSIPEFKYKLRHEPKTACPGCNSRWRGYEYYFFEALNSIGIKYVMPQYTNPKLRSPNNRPLRFDAAIFANKLDSVPYCIFEINDYHHFTSSIQGNLKTYYKNKVEFCRNVLQIPLIELDYRKHFKTKESLINLLQKIFE